MYLTKDQILQADDRKYQDVECPEWAGTVRVRSLSGMERDAFETSVLTGKGKNRDVNLRNLRAKLVALTVVDGIGEALFSEPDIKALGAKNAAALDRVFSVAQQLSGLREEDVEDLVKNSETDQSDGSISV